MAIIDVLDNSSGGAASAPVGIYRAHINFAKNNIGANDDMRIMKVYDGDILIGGYYKVGTAEGGTFTCDVGTAQNGTQLASNLNLNSAGNWTAMPTAPVFNSDTFIEITSDGYIWLNADHAGDKAVVDFMFLVIRANDIIRGS
jgi:hypothetical protein